MCGQWFRLRRLLLPVDIGPMNRANVLLAFTGAALAQAPAPIKRTPLQKFDVPGTNYGTVVSIAEIVPNVNIGRHTHPGPESGYMLEGEMTLLVDGQPPKPLKAGESY